MENLAFRDSEGSLFNKTKSSMHGL